MESLPPEIVSAVAEELEHLNLPDISYSHFTEISGIRSDHRIWRTYTSASKEDILNFRLVCRKCYSASFKSFGKILGDRTFHLTKQSLEDLQSISEVTELVPYIWTMTFGNARFGSDVARGKEFLRRAHDTGIRDQLTSSYHERYMCSLTDDALLSLTTTLLVFPNLQNFRLVEDNSSIKNPYSLGIWLRPSDVEELASARSLVSSYEAGDLMRNTCSNIGSYIFRILFEALLEAGRTIHDLRVEPAFFRNCIQELPLHSGVFSKLQVLHLHVEHTHFYTDNTTAGPQQVQNILKMAPQLSSLFLNMTSMISDLTLLLSTTGIMLETLSTNSHIRHIFLRGQWTFTEDQLATFIISHASTLQTLILDKPLLHSGTWHSFITKLLHSELPNMKHIDIVRPAEFTSYMFLGNSRPGIHFPILLASDFEPLSAGITYSLEIRTQKSNYTLGSTNNISALS